MKASVSSFYADAHETSENMFIGDIMKLQTIIFEERIFDRICNRIEECFKILKKSMSDLHHMNSTEIVDGLLQSLSNRSSPPHDKIRSSNVAHIWFEIWSIMGLFDGACWKNKANQVSLSGKIILFSNLKTFPIVCLDLLKCIQNTILLHLHIPKRPVSSSSSLECDISATKKQDLLGIEQKSTRRLILEIDSDTFTSYEAFISTVKCLISMVFPRYIS